ncbi:MAG: hypothetical protein NW201_09290 [Gemmatimonadales bacterium]|nr:hypothetical protein [Gemmatimonadales bacterium]
MPTEPAPPAWTRTYFATTTLLLLCLTLWGFSDNLVWRTGQPSNRDPKFIAHGLSCLTWMAVLAVQARLVRAGNVRLHRHLGVAGFLAAVAVTLSTAYVFVAVARPWAAMPDHIQANRLLLPGFAALTLLAWRNRRHPDRHRRQVLLASFFMLEPVLSRAFDPIDPLLLRFTDAQVDTAWWIFFVTTWSGLFVSLVAHDLATLRRVHPATAQGIALFAVIWAVVAVV